jgi:hypothetical protein
VLTQYRLCAVDRERYGGPEWVDFDISQCAELPVDLLEEVEDQTGYTISITLPVAMSRGGLKAVRAAVWLARHIAGVHEPRFADFKPNLLKADIRRVPDSDPAGDADPPAPNRATRRTVARSKPRKTASPSGG